MSTTPKSGSNWCQRLQNLYNIWRQRLHNLNQNDVNGSKIGIKLASMAPKSVPNWCQRLQNLDQIGVNSSKYLLNSGSLHCKGKVWYIWEACLCLCLWEITIIKNQCKYILRFGKYEWYRSLVFLHSWTVLLNKLILQEKSRLFNIFYITFDDTYLIKFMLSFPDSRFVNRILNLMKMESNPVYPYITNVWFRHISSVYTLEAEIINILSKGSVLSHLLRNYCSTGKRSVNLETQW